MIRYLALMTVILACTPVAQVERATSGLAAMSAEDDLAAATPEATPFTLVRRGPAGLASFGHGTFEQLSVKGLNGDTQFHTARADVPAELPIAMVYQFHGRGPHSNHVEIPLTRKGASILAPVGYPPGSELKVWAIQDETGENPISWDGAFIDHTGKGLSPLHMLPGESDFYHFYLRPNGVWWREVHN